MNGEGAQAPHPTRSAFGGSPSLLLTAGQEGGGGRGKGEVPRLDLSPKLKRPLRPWNPLDYLRLLYWVFFFPQALRWYVETFADPKHRGAEWRDLLPALREDPAQRNLALMGLFLAALLPPLVAVGLQWMGVPVDWFGVAFGVAFGVVGGVAVGVVGGVAVGVAFGVAFGVALLRLPDYLVTLFPTAWRWSRRGGGLNHVTPLPFPNVQKRLEAWLEADWSAGVHDVNQVLAYTLQFIPAVRAVNRALERMPEERLLPAVAELARNPYDWKLVLFGSVSLGNALRDAFVGELSASLLRARFRLPTEPRLDTPARAACAGFWYLHKKDLEGTVRAFGAVRHLPYGEEMLEIASLLKAAMEVEDIQGVATWAELGAAGLHGTGPRLRPGTTAALGQLAEAAGEVRTALRAVSPLLRSTAVGRAVGILTRLMETAGEGEEPEAALLREAAARWREVLARWGREIGEEVLLRPVENPFMEGASGRPVRKTFVGQSRVMERLERWWASPSDTPLPVLILYGHRRMGKSSILLQLREKRPPNILVAPIDMQDLIAADHTGQLLQKFAEAIHAAVRAAGLDPGPPPDRVEYASFGQATGALNRLLEHLHPQMAGRRLVLTVDEYELAEEKIEAGKFDPGFLRYLRAALGRHLWLNLILAGRQRLEEELRHYHAVFFGSAEPVKVTFLSQDEAVRLVRRPTDDFALDMEEALAEEIYRLTGGQPYLIQRLCYELVERWNERFRREGRDTPRRVTRQDLEAMLTPDFFREFFLTAEYYFSGVWEEAGPDGQCLLRAFAREGLNVRPCQDLIRAAGLSPEAGEAAICTLLTHDLVVEFEGGLRLAVPLMYPWLQWQASEKPREEAKR